MVRSLVFLLACSFPSTGWCCEPVVPIYSLLLLGGSSLAGPAILTHSLLWLLAAIAIKCGAFAFLDKRLPWSRAVFYMLLANVVSTIPGMFIAGFSAAFPFGLILVIPLVVVLGRMVQRRVLLLPQPGPLRGLSGGRAALAFMAFYFFSVATYVFSQFALHGPSFAAYWLLKFLSVAMVACTGIVISAVLEECVIARLSRKARGNLSFYTPVLRANYLTLALILLVAALEMLPKRLHAPHFLVSWVHSLLAIVGIA